MVSLLGVEREDDATVFLLLWGTWMKNHEKNLAAAGEAVDRLIQDLKNSNNGKRKLSKSP